MAGLPASAVLARPAPLPTPSASPAPSTPSQPNSYDVAAIGATASGRVGDVVRISIGIKNLGPGSAPGHHGVMGPHQGFGVALPPGTAVIGDPGGCATPPQPPPQFQGGSASGCAIQSSGLAANESIILVLDVVIKQKSSAQGAVRRSYYGGVSSLPDLDTNPANNTAPITITVLPGGKLPVTGMKVSVAAGIGAACIAVGALLLMAVRRRAR